MSAEEVLVLLLSAYSLQLLFEFGSVHSVSSAISGYFKLITWTLTDDTLIHFFICFSTSSPVIDVLLRFVLKLCVSMLKLQIQVVNVML